MSSGGGQEEVGRLGGLLGQRFRRRCGGGQERDREIRRIRRRCEEDLQEEIRRSEGEEEVMKMLRRSGEDLEVKGRSGI